MTRLIPKLKQAFTSKLKPKLQAPLENLKDYYEKTLPFRGSVPEIRIHPKDLELVSVQQSVPFRSMSLQSVIQPPTETLTAPVLRIKPQKLSRLETQFKSKEAFAIRWPKIGRHLHITDAQDPLKKHHITWDENTSHMTGRVVLDQLASKVMVKLANGKEVPIEQTGIFYRKSLAPEGAAIGAHSDNTRLQGIHYLNDPQQYQANRKQMPLWRQLLTRKVPILALSPKTNAQGELVPLGEKVVYMNQHEPVTAVMEDFSHYHRALEGQRTFTNMRYDINRPSLKTELRGIPSWQ